MTSTRRSSLPTALSSFPASRRASSISWNWRKPRPRRSSTSSTLRTRARTPPATVQGSIQPAMGGRDMKRVLIAAMAAVGVLCAPSMPAAAKTRLSFAFVTDPTHEMYVYALRQGLVRSDKIELELVTLAIPALVQGFLGPPVRHRRDQHDLDPAGSGARLQRQPAVHGARPAQPRSDAGHLGQARQPRKIDPRSQGQEDRGVRAGLHGADR